MRWKKRRTLCAPTVADSGSALGTRERGAEQGFDVVAHFGRQRVAGAGIELEGGAQPRLLVEMRPE